MVTEQHVQETLKNCFDPELRIDIITLGLVYGITVDSGRVSVRMTFTSAACPYGTQLVEEVKLLVQSIPGVTQAEVDVVFTPPWEPSPELRAALGVG